MNRVPLVLVLVAALSLSVAGAAVRAVEPPPEEKQEKVDITARRNLAESLANSGKAIEAADEFVWLWENMLKHDPSYTGVRISYMAGDMEKLASASSEAKAKFVALRDKTAKKVDGAGSDADAVYDWVVLNQVVSDPNATVAWYTRVKGDKAWAPHVARAARNLSSMFIEEKRYADLGTLYPDPLKFLRDEHQFMKVVWGGSKPSKPNMDEEERRAVEDEPLRHLRRYAAPVYGGLLAAGRESVAGKYAALARETDPSTKMVEELVGWALKADQPREEQRAWLKDAKGASPELQKQLDTALEKRKAAPPAPPAPATPPATSAPASPASPPPPPSVEKK